MKGKKLLCLTLVLCLTVALAVSNVVTVSADIIYYTGTQYSLQEICNAHGGYTPGDNPTYQRISDADGQPVNEGEQPAPDQITFTEAGEYQINVDDIDLNKFTITVDENAEAKSYTRISGVEYKLNDLLDYFGLEMLDGETTLSGGRSVKYRITANADGIGVAEDEEGYSESSITDVDGKIEFKNVGTYSVYVYTGTGDGAVLDRSFSVKVTKNVTPADADYNKTSVSYKNDMEAYKLKVAEAAKDLITGDSFEVPSLAEYIENSDFSYDTVQKKVYYCAPDATSYTQGSTVTTSNASFTVDKLGTYTYYVLFADVFGNEMTTENLVLGKGGWYKTEDNDGKTQIGNVVIPVFSFTVDDVKSPEISVKVSENAYIGLNYEVKSFNIVSDSYSTVYKLYYSANYYDKDDSTKYANDSAYIQDVTAQGHSEDITDDLNTSSLTFTPEKTGYYYVEVMVVDEHNNSDVAMSRAIECMGEAKSVVVEKEFAKNNVTSIIFLSIAGVCFIAIIVLLLVKPKEKQTVEVEGEADNGNNEKK